VQVETIHLNDGYYGIKGYHAGDIAIIVLQNKITFSNGVAPICIDWDDNYNVINGEPGKVGLQYNLNDKIVINITLNYCSYHCRPFYILCKE